MKSRFTIAITVGMLTLGSLAWGQSAPKHSTHHAQKGVKSAKAAKKAASGQKVMMSCCCMQGGMVGMGGQMGMMPMQGQKMPMHGQMQMGGMHGQMGNMMPMDHMQGHGGMGGMQPPHEGMPMPPMQGMHGMGQPPMMAQGMPMGGGMDPQMMAEMHDQEMRIQDLMKAMNEAPQDKKLDAAIAVINALAEQHAHMHRMMMQQHMMPPMGGMGHDMPPMPASRPPKATK